MQDEILRRYAGMHDHEVVAVFSDDASGRDAEHRDDFMRLIEVVSSDVADFEAILVRDVSRWGRFENTDEAAYYDFLCFRHGVSVIYVEESFGPEHSPYASLMKSMKRVLAAEFSREKARIVTYGKRRTAERGFRSGAPPPYGMKRILVTPDGAYVQDMPKGMHKIVSAYKTKLAPARDATTAVVLKIFESFVDRRMRVTPIVMSLNRAEIPSPGGKRWTAAAVTYILTNPAYGGIGSLNVPGSSGATIRVEGAHEGIVPQKTFEAAEQRIADMQRPDRTTRSGLIREARAAYERWGHLPAALLCELSSVGHHRRTDDTPIAMALLEQVFAVEIAAAKRALCATLANGFAVDDHGSHLVLDRVVTVGFRIGWRRIDLLGGPVHFSFTGDEPHDYYLCLGCETVPEFQVVMRCLGIGPKIRTGGAVQTLRQINAHGHPSTYLMRIESDEWLVRRLGREIRTNRETARAKFLDAAVRTGDRLSFRKLSRDLNWPESTTARVYYELRQRGEALPDHYHTPTRPKRQKRAVRKLVAVCPRCGAKREVWPSVAKKMKGGLAALCKPCGTSDMIASTAARNRELRPERREKHEFLRELGLLVFRAMNAKPAEYRKPTLRPLKNRRLATLRWRSVRDNVKHQLTLDCTRDFLVRCKTSEKANNDGTLAEAILDRSTWIGGHLDAKKTRIWLRKLE